MIIAISPCGNAYKDGQQKGRIACILNYSQRDKEGIFIARFGWMDFVDDEDVSEALIKTVEKYAKEHGAQKLTGPMGFCDFDRQGLLIEGFDELGSMVTLYNYSYYARHLERLDYVKDVDMVEYRIKNSDTIPKKIERISTIVLQRMNLRIVPLKKAKDILPYAKGIFLVMNEAYEDLHGITFITDKQIEYYKKQYFSFIDPDYVKIIVDENDEVVAFCLSMPSLSKALQKTNGRLFPFGFIQVLKALKKNDTLELYFVGVKPALQNKGINAILMAELTKSAIQKGIKIAESSVELKPISRYRHFGNTLNTGCIRGDVFFIKDLG